MLKEINVKAAIGAMIEGREVLALQGRYVTSLKDVLEGMRFLVEEEPKQKKQEEEKPKKEGPQKDCNQKEQEILKAWNGGERSIKEIMEITGAAYSTVRKYIPETAKG